MDHFFHTYSSGEFQAASNTVYIMKQLQGQYQRPGAKWIQDPMLGVVRFVFQHQLRSRLEKSVISFRAYHLSYRSVIYRPSTSTVRTQKAAKGE